MHVLINRVIKARQGSLVERKRGPTKTQSYSQRKRACEDATMGSIEEEIRLRTQNGNLSPTFLWLLVLAH